LYCLLDPQLVRYTPPLITVPVRCQGYCERRSGGAIGWSKVARFEWRLRCARAVDTISCVRRRGGALRDKNRVVSYLPKGYSEEATLEKRPTLIRAHTLQSGHATARGFELALQSSIYLKPLHERVIQYNKSSWRSVLVVDKCRSGKTLNVGTTVG